MMAKKKATKKSPRDLSAAKPIKGGTIYRGVAAVIKSDIS
jgi:hypothetical protein